MTPFTIEPFDDLRRLNAPFEWLLNATLLVTVFGWRLVVTTPSPCHGSPQGLAWSNLQQAQQVYGTRLWVRCAWHDTPFCLWLPN